ncbi:hypothetical protein F4827_003908 [Paraburkholderia bannensis]|uniref:Uncharacterized protein n=1 Tax=Paraburkholderia bannensis TaxID=765414 RepID=A0A7W9TZH7_9BURK|nr:MULTISPECIES: hypothetical protein [Paraburkholderia]MBB3259034.1 hypothetical protein [Paraburkholderia sp. WP4_3_2]MBB6104049.1 hypothetical protein [Paraburkholderia bannensis]
MSEPQAMSERVIQDVVAAFFSCASGWQKGVAEAVAEGIAASA